MDEPCLINENLSLVHDSSLHMKRSINGGLLGKVDDAGTDNHVILLNIKKKKFT